jgi:hypothetical protein
MAQMAVFYERLDERSCGRAGLPASGGDRWAAAPSCGYMPEEAQACNDVLEEAMLMMRLVGTADRCGCVVDLT